VNGEGGIGQAEEDIAYLRREFVTGVEFGTSSPGGYYPDISVGPFIPQFSAYAQLPVLRDLPMPTYGPEQLPVETPPGPGELATGVIDPAYNPQETVSESEVSAVPVVYEDAPGGIFEVPRAPTDWDRVYDEYVILNPPEVVLEPPVITPPVIEPTVVANRGQDMAIDWGAIVGAAAESYFSPAMGMAQAVQASFAGAPAPVIRPSVTVDPRTGKVVCKRRRRRRLLTESDFNDLMRIATLPNKETVKIALAKSIGRR